MNEPTDHPIPRAFHSEYEERPFQSCSRCGEALDVFENYQINKAYRNGECVFEYVFCSPCRDSLLEEFSEESKSNMLRHQEEHLREVRGIEECAFCGKSQVETPMRDYVITALCRKTSLLDSLMICEPCQLGMHELLSEKTRDVRRRFFEDLPGVPPDWEPAQSLEESPQLVKAGYKLGAEASSLAKMSLGSQMAKLCAIDPQVKHAADDGCLELLWMKWRL
jgi:hypothetical protein